METLKLRRPESGNFPGEVNSISHKIREIGDELYLTVSVLLLIVTLFISLLKSHKKLRR
jgi:hypothetical protein